MDNGFGMLRTMLSYKLADRGKQLVIVGKWFPSWKRCRTCGAKDEALTLTDRSWTCAVCGTRYDRDANAARNIRDEGIRILTSEST